MGVCFTFIINDTIGIKAPKIFECSLEEKYLYIPLDSAIRVHSVQLADSADCFFSEKLIVKDSLSNEFIASITKLPDVNSINRYLWENPGLKLNTNADTLVITNNGCCAQNSFSASLVRQKKKNKFRKEYQYWLSDREKFIFRSDSI